MRCPSSERDDAGRPCTHLGRLERVVGREVDLHHEDTPSVRRIRRPHDSRLPREQVIHRDGTCRWGMHARNQGAPRLRRHAESPRTGDLMLFTHPPSSWSVGLSALVGNAEGGAARRSERWGRAFRQEGALSSHREPRRAHQECTQETCTLAAATRRLLTGRAPRSHLEVLQLLLNPATRRGMPGKERPCLVQQILANP